MIINDRTFVPDALQGCLIGAASCFVARVTPRLKAFDLRRRRSEPLRCLAHVAAIRTRWAVGRAHRPRGRPGKDDRGGPGAGWESSLEAGRARHGPPPGPRHRRGKGACHRRRSARSPRGFPTTPSARLLAFPLRLGCQGRAAGIQVGARDALVKVATEDGEKERGAWRVELEPDEPGGTCGRTRWPRSSDPQRSTKGVSRTSCAGAVGSLARPAWDRS